MKKLFSLVVAAVATSATVAHAAAPATVSDLATGVSFADVSTAILAITGAIISLTVVMKGAKFVVRAVRGA